MEFKEVIEFYNMMANAMISHGSPSPEFNRERLEELKSHEFVLFPEPAEPRYTSWKCARCGIIFSASKSGAGFSTTGHILNIGGNWPRGSFPGMCNLNMMHKALK